MADSDVVFVTHLCTLWTVKFDLSGSYMTISTRRSHEHESVSYRIALAYRCHRFESRLQFRARADFLKLFGCMQG